MLSTLHIYKQKSNRFTTLSCGN